VDAWKARAMLKYFVALILTLTFFTQYAVSQTEPDPASPPQPKVQKTADRLALESADIAHAQDRLQQEMMTRVMAERQEALRRDTEKLVALAAELKQNVDRTNANILSMDVIKKAQEIQKLAKSVQDKMKNAF